MLINDYFGGHVGIATIDGKRMEKSQILYM